MFWYYSKWVCHCFSFHYIASHYIPTPSQDNSECTKYKTVPERQPICFCLWRWRKSLWWKNGYLCPDESPTLAIQEDLRAFFFCKDVSTAFQQFLPRFLPAEVTSQWIIFKMVWHLDDDEYCFEAFKSFSNEASNAKINIRPSPGLQVFGKAQPSFGPMKLIQPLLLTTQYVNIYLSFIGPEMTITWIAWISSFGINPTTTVTRFISWPCMTSQINGPHAQPTSSKWLPLFGRWPWKLCPHSWHSESESHATFMCSVSLL